LSSLAKKKEKDILQLSLKGNNNNSGKTFVKNFLDFSQ